MAARLVVPLGTAANGRAGRKERRSERLPREPSRDRPRSQVFYSGPPIVYPIEAPTRIMLSELKSFVLLKIL